MLIKETSLKIQEYQCRCGYVGGSRASLGKHLKWKHPEIEKRVFWESFYNLKKSVCQCGCGAPSPWSSKAGFVGYHDYIAGHNILGRIPWNKGEKKESNPALAQLSETVSRSVKKLWEDGAYSNRKSNCIGSRHE